MLRGHGASRLCPPYARFTLPCRGRVDRPTGPARSGRPDGRLRRAGWGARRWRSTERSSTAPPVALVRDGLPLQGRLARVPHYDSSSAPPINSAAIISPFSPTSKYLFAKPAVELAVYTHLTADMMKLN